MISALDLGWVAGFLEGEGTFYFPTKVHGYSGTPCVTACQVQREPLDRLERLFGGSTLDQRRSSLRLDGTHGSIWRWRLHGWKAVGLMMTLYPLMSPRRKGQIAAVLTKWRARPGRNWFLKTRTTCAHGHEYAVHGYVVTLRGRRPKRGCRICSRRRVNETNARHPERARVRSRLAYARKKALCAAS